MTDKQALKERIIEKHFKCNCDEGYTSRKLIDPNCIKHNYEEFVENCLQEYEDVLANEKSTTVTRVEVIDFKGRSYVNWRPNNRVRISYQDDNRTLKIFITEYAPQRPYKKKQSNHSHDNHCPTCGSEVKISSDEETSHYIEIVSSLRLRIKELENKLGLANK